MVALRLPGNNLTSTELTLSGFASLSHLAVLDLSDNALSGPLPLQMLIGLINEGKLRSIDLDGNEVEREADDLEARMYQHELDHLHGVLMFDRMTPEQRSEALAEYRRLSAPEPERRGFRRLPLR